MQAVNQNQVPSVGEAMVSLLGRSGVMQRLIASRNGINQSDVFAKPITGDGAGEIVLIAKFADTGKPFKICDGATSANRFDVNILDTGSVGSLPPGITLTVDGEVKDIPFAQMVEIRLTGDFTGLVLARLFSRYTDENYAEVQPLYFSYKDQSQAFETGFGSGQPFEVFGAYSRDVFPLLTPVIGDTWEEVEERVFTNTGANWGSWLTFTQEHGDVFVLDITVSGNVSNTKLNNGTSENMHVLAGRQTVVIYGKQGLRVAANTGGTVEIHSIKKVPNALVMKDPSTNPADDWAEYVQLPDGTWISKKAIKPTILNSQITASGNTYTFERETYTHLNYDLPVDSAGETVRVEYTLPADTGENDGFGDNDGLTWPTVIDHSATKGRYEKDIALKTAKLKIYPFKYDSRPALTIERLIVRHVIKLSDHLANQHRIQQVKQAIADYQARYGLVRYVPDADGIDDAAVFDCQPATGDFDCYITAETADGDSWDNLVSLTDARFVLAAISAGGEVRFDTVNNEYPPFVGGDYAPAKFYVYSLHRRGTVLTVKQDHAVLGTVTGYTPPVALKQILMDVSGIGGPDGFIGHAKDLVWIDHANPLPIGQGGNSGFWPLDDADNTARQVLGLDAKGNVVAKPKASYGPEMLGDGWQVNAALNYSTSGNEHKFDVHSTWGQRQIEHPVSLEAGAIYVIEAQLSGASRIALKFDSANTVPPVGFIKNDYYGSYQDLVEGEKTVLVAFIPTDADVNNGLLGVATTVSEHGNEGSAVVSMQKLEGAGQWQGNPDRELFALDKVSGALFGAERIGLPGQFFADSTWQSKGDQVYTRSGVTGWNALGVSDHQPGDIVTVEVEILETVKGSLKLYYRNADDSANLNKSLSVGMNQHEIVVLFGTSARSVWLDSADWEGTARISFKDKLPLSAELQRQHDLAAVEKQIARLDRQYAKAMPLLQLDGIDDIINVPPVAPSGGHEVETIFLRETTTSGQFLFSEYDDGYGSNIYLTGDYANDNGQAVVFSTAAGFFGLSQDVLYKVGFKFDGGKHEEVLSGNVVERGTATPAVDTANATKAVIGGAAHNNGFRFQGLLGPLKMIDYANPKNSRYYVATESGLKDLLGDGSTDGTYQGNPDAPQTFTKSGDDWVGPELFTYGAYSSDGSEAQYSTQLGKYGVIDGAEGGEYQVVVDVPDDFSSDGRMRVIVGNDSLYITPADAGKQLKAVLTPSTSTPVVLGTADGSYWTASGMSVSVKQIIKGA